jgi:hypothetical protein
MNKDIVKEVLDRLKYLDIINWKRSNKELYLRYRDLFEKALQANETFARQQAQSDLVLNLVDLLDISSRNSVRWRDILVRGIPYGTGNNSYRIYRIKGMHTEESVEDVDYDKIFNKIWWAVSDKETFTLVFQTTSFTDDEDEVSTKAVKFFSEPHPGIKFLRDSGFRTRVSLDSVQFLQGQVVRKIQNREV